MLKYRLIFGTLMISLFAGLFWLDGLLDGVIAFGDKHIQATLFCVVISLLAIPAQLEIGALFKNVGAKVFTPIVMIFSVLLATSWYWKQFVADGQGFHLHYVLFVSAFSLLALFVYQARTLGTKGTIINCGASFFAIFYLGFLSSFVLGIRIEFGLQAMIMFLFVVKSSDIGAYTVGRLFGKHKFSPRISPGKTWEGIAGAAVFAAIVSLVFAKCFGIMDLWAAVLFGVLFAYLGQLGDLAESMIKRDAEQKDSASRVPGFGGVLDIIDSPLATAPLAYLYFMFAFKS